MVSLMFLMAIYQALIPLALARLPVTSFIRKRQDDSTICAYYSDSSYSSESALLYKLNIVHR